MPDIAGGLGLALKIAMDLVPDRGGGAAGGGDQDHPGYDPGQDACQLHPEGCSQDDEEQSGDCGWAGGGCWR